MKVFRSLLVLMVVSLTLGCGSSPVVDDISQREANKIVAVLAEHGIQASTEKARGAKGRYSVLVSSGDFRPSAALLSKLGLPTERGASFADLMVPRGILPSSQDVEDLRMDRAIASEIEDLIVGHEGIQSASVVVRYHSAPGGAPPSISLVVQARRGLAINQTAIRELASRAVPGVKGADVYLSLTEQGVDLAAGAAGSPDAGLVPFLRFWRVPASEYNGLAMLIVVLMFVVALLVGVAGYIYGQYEASKAAENSGARFQGGGAAQVNGETPADEESSE